MSEDLNQFDVLIVGGGPAGSATALSLLNYTDLSVLVVEQSDLNSVRVGEHVSKGIFDLLDYLKVDIESFEENTFLSAHESISYWGSDQPTSVHSVFTTEQASFQLNRQNFDLALLKAVSDKGGELLPRTKCIQASQVNDEWIVSLQHREKGTLKVKTRYLVDAGGRSTSLSRQLGCPSNKLDRLMGIGAFFKVKSKHSIAGLQLLETNELGWWYTATLPNNYKVISFFTDADIISTKHLDKVENWKKLLLNTKKVQQQFSALHIDSSLWVRNASSQITDSSLQKYFIAVGDATCSFDPISSMGIGFAMTSGCHAGKVIKSQLQKGDDLSKETFQQDLSDNFEVYKRIRQQYYLKEHRWPEATFWKRRR